MIARRWNGRVPAAKADEYVDILKRTGVKDLRATQGNRGVWVLRRIHDDIAEFTLISIWDSFEAIRRFAGEHTEKAVYYPEDDTFLLEKEPEVAHFEVVVADAEAASTKD